MDLLLITLGYSVVVLIRDCTCAILVLKVVSHFLYLFNFLPKRFLCPLCLFYTVTLHVFQYVTIKP